MRGGDAKNDTAGGPGESGGGDPGNHAIPADFSDAIPGKHQALPWKVLVIQAIYMANPGVFLESRPQNRNATY